MRLLYVSHAFPPQAGGGIRRISNAVRLMGREGIQLSVLTRTLSKACSQRAGIPTDYDLRHQLDQDVNIRITSAITLEPLYYFLKKRPATRSGSQDQARVRRGWKDTAYLWVPFAIIRGLFIRCDLIYATGPSFASFLVAWILSIVRNKRLMVEYRDSWLLDPSIETSPFQTQVIRTLEAWVLDRASCIISTTRGIARSLERFYGVATDRITLIRNGFLRDDAAGLEVERVRCAYPPYGYHIAHIGTLSTGRNAEQIIQAISKQPFHDGMPIFVHFVGTTPGDEAALREAAERFGIPARIICHGFVTRKASLAMMANAHAVLLLINTDIEDTDGFGVPGKLGDYALMNGTILASDKAAAFLQREFIQMDIAPSFIDGFSAISIPDEALDFEQCFGDFSRGLGMAYGSSY